VLDHGRVEPGLDKGGPVLGSLDVAVENLIEKPVRRKRVLVDLVGT